MASQSPPTTPELAVVTVSYGSEDVLPAFLASIPASTSAEPLVLVVDNKPEAGGRVAEMTTSSGAVYLPLDRNAGYGTAINAAARQLPPSVDWILISNPDVTLEPNSVDRLLETARRDDSIGAVGPAILTSDGEIYPSARAIPSLRHGIGHALFVNLWADNPWSRRYRNEYDSAPVGREAGWLSGANLLVRRSAFDAVGGFDEGYFMYFEDVDLGYRMTKAGYRNLYEPEARVTHTGAHSTTTESAAMIVAHHDSARRFLDRKYSGAALFPVRVALRAGLAVRSRLARRNLD